MSQCICYLIISLWGSTTSCRAPFDRQIPPPASSPFDNRNRHDCQRQRKCLTNAALYIHAHHAHITGISHDNASAHALPTLTPAARPGGCPNPPCIRSLGGPISGSLALSTWLGEDLTSFGTFSGPLIGTGSWFGTGSDITASVRSAPFRGASVPASFSRTELAGGRGGSVAAPGGRDGVSAGATEAG